MSKKKKKKPAKPQKSNQQTMSPQNYILTGRARNLPMETCWISDHWQEGGLATILVPRMHVTGNVTLGLYLVDVFCLGVKNAYYKFNIPSSEFQMLLNRTAQAHGGVSPIDYDSIHTLIFEAIDYAKSLGIKPHKDFDVAQFVLNPRNSVPPRGWEFGKDGKPFLIVSPYDNITSIVNKLNQSVGAGNYGVGAMSGGFMDDFDDDDYDDYDDEDDDYDDDDDDIEEADYEEIK